jgi:hypothetical protein
VLNLFFAVWKDQVDSRQTFDARVLQPALG